MTRATLIVFLKVPRAGRVKTRLGREIGFGRAAVLFRRMTEIALKEASKGSWRSVLAIDPGTQAFSARPPWDFRFARLAQGRGSLGDRMAAAMRAVRGGPMVIIGADAPRLRAAHIKAAFKALGAADAVFGPAEDGGYWLIGLARRRSAPNIFDGVRWSSPHALADTIASLPPLFQLAYLPVLNDIDDAAGLAKAGPLLLSAR
ncbi:MAG: TIGR04282 family arsenosugar biosynthesis glycosyltransferase [Parvularculaceae bacterium]